MMTAADKEKWTRSIDERRQLSAAAKALLADKAFSETYWNLHQQWWGELATQPGAGPRQDELCARLRSIEEFVVLLGKLSEAQRAA